MTRPGPLGGILGRVLAECVVDKPERVAEVASEKVPEYIAAIQAYANAIVFHEQVAETRASLIAAIERYAEERAGVVEYPPDHQKLDVYGDCPCKVCRP